MGLKGGEEKRRGEGGRGVGWGAACASSRVQSRCIQLKAEGGDMLGRARRLLGTQMRASKEGRGLVIKEGWFHVVDGPSMELNQE